MKKGFIGLIALASISVAALSAGVSPFPLTRSHVMTALFNKDTCDFVVKKSTYTACYDKRGKITKWDFYTLDGPLMNRLNIKHRPPFYPEFSIPKRYRAYPSDYTRSGYDRGHLRPDAATDYDPVALGTTYSMVNIVPQRPMVNRKMWSKAERYARIVAVKLGRANVMNIMTFAPGKSPAIGKRRVAVPSGFYKVIARESGEPIRCFYYRNLDYSDAEARADRLRNHLVDCGSIDISRIPPPRP